MKRIAAIVLIAQAAAGAASAQYYYEERPRYERRYERVERDPYGYEAQPRYRQGPSSGYGYDGPRYRNDGPRGRGYGQGYDQGYGGGYGSSGQRNNGSQGYGAGQVYGGAPAYRAGPSLEDQKRMIKNHREAQKKAIKRGYVIP